jgi:hypothetical protein
LEEPSVARTENWKEERQTVTMRRPTETNIKKYSGSLFSALGSALIGAASAVGLADLTA